MVKKCCLSSGYFGNLVRVETDRTAKDIIADHVLVYAKQLLNVGHLLPPHVITEPNTGLVGEGFIRMNIACPRKLLADGLERITHILSKN